MAEDGESGNRSMLYKPQETFHRPQETPPERRFPIRPPGIVNLPPGSRGPKSLYLKRHGDSFGFTLRHFIVYPPDSIGEDDGRHAAVGALLAPMDTIFVRDVAEGSPARKAGLQIGDRIISVNGVSVTNKPYPQVVSLIQRSPDYLHLLVVPKEDDVLQQYFTDAAHNPLSNQPPRRQQDEREAALRFLTQKIRETQNSLSFQVDVNSWNRLQNPYNQKQRYSYGQDLEHIYNTPVEVHRTQEVYTDPHVLHASIRRSRAQPQVPLYRKMGRRASEGSTFSEHENYYDCLSEMVVGDTKMKAASKSAYVPDANPTYPNSAGCRLSLDAGRRRESSASLTSSLADGSKDSVCSFDSVSTVTGQETDDSIMTRFRKSFQQKEEFLRRPSKVEAPLIPREFYGRPKRLEKPTWPPYEPVRQDSPTRTAKPTHQNFQRVKNDIDSERDLVYQVQNGEQKVGRSIGVDVSKMYEAAVAPSALDSKPERMNGSLTADNSHTEESRMYPPPLQIVSKRAKQFESGKPMPEEEAVCTDRTSFYRSELSNLSSKKLEPNVADRTREFETISSEPRKDAGGNAVESKAMLKRNHRDTRSLESAGSDATDKSIKSDLSKLKLSGNVLISSGSKFIHCPPPESVENQDLDNQPVRMRDRSNSADSWASALQDPQAEEKAGHLDAQEAMDASAAHYADLPPLIPEPVERMQAAPSLAITPAPKSPAVRPNQLDLSYRPTRPARHLRPPSTTSQRSISPVGGDDANKNLVVRRTKHTNLDNEESVVRRESYLKATHRDSDHSDSDVSPKRLHSAHRKWRPPLFPGDIDQLRKLFEDAASSLGGSASGGSSSSLSVEKERLTVPKSEDGREGSLHCKITEIDGKRAADRSWKQAWVVLQGSKLYLCKDRNHQNPPGVADAVEPTLAAGVDMRSSAVGVAEDYTKRKHVLRVSAKNPCRSEFLLQAENTLDLDEWVKALKEHVAASTEFTAKLDPANIKQQAVPQASPAHTSVEVPSNRLSPQPSKSKSNPSRSRSPTGQSPASKTRKNSQVLEPCTSPKSKTWRGRVAKQFRKIQQGANSPSSPTAPEGSTFGVPIDQCIQSPNNPYIPRFVEICTAIIEERGLNVVGIYRVPGNNASVTALTEEVNRNYDDVPQEDPRWNDVHVVSSLLKSYFRKMPDSLITSALYPKIIEADKIEDPRQRLEEIKRLIERLPPHNYHTLKHIILHLRNIVNNSDVNKMEAKNLAIVFGPTIIRAEEENMQTMVNNMTHQCKVVESLLSYANWFFGDEAPLTLLAPPRPAVTHMGDEPVDVATNQALLLDNISKYEALKDQKEKNGALFSSIISAAQRKVKRKTIKSGPHVDSGKEEVMTPNGMKEFTYPAYPSDQNKQNTAIDNKGSVIPITVTEMEKPKPIEKPPWFNYSTDKEDFHRRVENFEQETRAMLTMPRKSEIIIQPGVNPSSAFSSSAGNVNHNPRLSVRHEDPYVLTKTHSATNVFSRAPNANPLRNSLDTIGTQFAVQYSEISDRNSENNNRGHFESAAYRTNNYSENNGANASELVRNAKPQAFDRYVMRRGSSVENLNAGSMDVNANGTMKKLRFENENELHQRTGSLDSLNKLQAHLDDGPDLVTTITQIIDEKLKNDNSNSILTGDGLPYADESPEKTAQKQPVNNENMPPNYLYRNPSLHKSQYSASKIAVIKSCEAKEIKKGELEKEKDEDSSAEIVPDNERHLPFQDKLNLAANKLKRSESLNKPDRIVPPVSVKLKRSESLNKSSDKLKRSDSLTKYEKTESNISKRREWAASKHRSKRKNGMPDRSIKRRHTVGGTKDPDKVNWLDNKYQEEVAAVKETNKEKATRTSSPDLSSARRDRLLLEINFSRPDDIVVALRQHLVGARPQSFTDATVFKVPLESHV